MTQTKTELMRIPNRRRAGTSRNYILSVDGVELGRVQRKQWSEWLAAGKRHLTQAGAEQHLINLARKVSDAS